MSTNPPENAIEVASHALFGRLLQPDEHVIEGDKILLVGGSWITANGGNGHINTARDFIEVCRTNSQAGQPKV